MNVSTAFPQRPQRIGVLRALYLGDLIVAVPALRALRARFPEAEITLLGLPWAQTFVQRFHQYLDRLVIFPGYPGLKEGGGSPDDMTRFIAEQRAYSYDLLIQMHGSGKTSNALLGELKGKYAVGYYEAEKTNDLQLALPYPQGWHEILRNLQLVEYLGSTALDPQLEFPLDTADHAEAHALLASIDDGSHVKDGLPGENGPLIGIHPGSRSPARRWPVAYFAALANELVTRRGARIVLTGSEDERETVRGVMERLSVPALDLSGRTSLGGLAALIKKLDLFISNDTGPAHIACAVDCPSVTVFGPAEYERWAPLDHVRHPTVRRPVTCSPCVYWECPIDHRCLRWLTPDMIVPIVERLLYETSQNPDMAYTRKLSELPRA